MQPATLTAADPSPKAALLTQEDFLCGIGAFRVVQKVLLITGRCFGAGVGCKSNLFGAQEMKSA